MLEQLTRPEVFAALTEDEKRLITALTARTDVDGKPTSTTSNDAILAQKAAEKQQPPPQSWLEGALSGFGGRIADTARGIWDAAQQVPAMAGYLTGASAFDPALRAQGKNAIAAIPQGMIEPQFDQLRKAAAAPTGGFEQRARSVAAAIPIAGPYVANKVDQFASGRGGEAIGEFGADVLMAALPVALSRLKLNPSVLLNPVQRKAVEFAVKNDVHMDLATATGDPFYGGVKAATEKLPTIAKKARLSEMQTETDLQRVGQRLSATRPLAGEKGAMLVEEPLSKLQVGSQLSKSVVAKTGEAKAESDANYGALRELAQQPQNIKNVFNGQYRDIPSGVSMGMPPKLRVLEPIAGPVNLKTVKAELRPLLTAIEKRIPLAEREASPGLHALRDVLESPDFVSIDKAINDLSAIRAGARSDSKFTRTVSQGIAARVGALYGKELYKSAAQLGPEGLSLLRAGEAATRNKFRYDDLSEMLGKEPVKAVNKLTGNNDSTINALRSIADDFPEVVPDLGKATLESIMTKAKEEGGFKGQGALAKWNTLGEETKKVLFPSDSMREDLDSFFNLAKMSKTDANPSGSGKVASLMATGMFMIRHPIHGTAYFLPAKGAANIIYGNGGAKILTRALAQPLASQAGQDTAMRLWIAYLANRGSGEELR